MYQGRSDRSGGLRRAKTVGKACARTRICRNRKSCRKKQIYNNRQRDAKFVFASLFLCNKKRLRGICAVFFKTGCLLLVKIANCKAFQRKFCSDRCWEKLSFQTVSQCIDTRFASLRSNRCRGACQTRFRAQNFAQCS